MDDFTVRVVIADATIPEAKFQGELLRYSNKLEMEDAVVNIGNLIDAEYDVTFVCGVAGIGKSVLSKQIAVAWAAREMYQEISVCYFVHCRDLNVFLANQGKNCDGCEVIPKFLKQKVYCEVINEADTLLIIDGIDELPSNQIDSIVKSLLRKDGTFCKSKIILTGRPHVEHCVLRIDTSTRESRYLEIQGFQIDQVEEYIQKFEARTWMIDDDKVIKAINTIRKAKDASAGVEHILCVPHFLNWFCCVGVLSEGEGVLSLSELYSWMLFLLLKQHLSEKVDTPALHAASAIFRMYSGIVTSIATLSFALLKMNEINCTGSEFEHFPTNNLGKDLISSLFYELPDDFDIKYTFKHLTLMEFLSAVYCFSRKDRCRKDVVSELLDLELFQVLQYYCGLDGSILSKDSNMTKCLAYSIKKDGYMTDCFSEVMDAVSASELDNGNKLRIVWSCFREYYSRIDPKIETIHDILHQIRSFGGIGTVLSCTKNDLSNFLYFFNKVSSTGITNEDLKSVFSSTLILLRHPVDPEFLDYFDCFGGVNLSFEYCKSLSVSAILNSYRFFKNVREIRFIHCQCYDRQSFSKETLQTYGCESVSSKYKSITISCSELDEHSFTSFVAMALMCTKVHLHQLQLDESQSGWTFFQTGMKARLMLNSIMLRKLDVHQMNFKEKRVIHAVVDVLSLIENVDLSRVGACEEFIVELVDCIQKRNKDNTLKLKRLSIFGGNIAVPESMRIQVRVDTSSFLYASS